MVCKKFMSVVYDEKTFYGTTDFNIISTVDEVSYVLLKNPTNRKILITNFRIGVNAVDTAAIFKIYANPVISVNGTQVAINNYNLGSAKVGSSQMFKFPTVTNKGQLIFASKINSNSDSKGVDKLIALDPNTSLLITVTVGLVDKPVHVDISIIEE